MDNRYKPLAIPQRDSQPTFPKLTQTKSAFEDLINAAKFAEIEYEATSTPSDYAQQSYHTPIQQSAQPISPQTFYDKESDPIKAKFLEMRHIFYDNPYTRNDAELFYKQAKFMEDFKDDYTGNESFSMYFPNYQYMGHEQLRTYFTWRTKIRKGLHQPTSLSYIFVYTYELLSGIGVSSPSDGLNKLLTLWNSHRKEIPALDKYFPSWFKDYHIYYELPFAEFVDENKFHDFYPQLYLLEANEENCLLLWNSMSKYNITKSLFYNSDNKELMHSCFYNVIGAIVALCKKQNIYINRLLFQEVITLHHWRPFPQALFYPWLDHQGSRWIELPGSEVYYCIDNEWRAEVTMPHANQGDIVGYIIRKTEECLRRAVKYKHKIMANIKSVTGPFREFRKIGFTRQHLDAVIEKTVVEHCKNVKNTKNTKRTIVSVDMGNLERIRKEALGTQDLLVVPEGISETQDTHVGANYVRSSVDEVVEMDIREIQSPDFASGWTTFRMALNLIEMEALYTLIKGCTKLKSFADSKGVMLEVLADNINEKANDHIGDNILDEEFEIYEDYKTQITEMVESND